MISIKFCIGKSQNPKIYIFDKACPKSAQVRPPPEYSTISQALAKPNDRNISGDQPAWPTYLAHMLGNPV